MRRGLAAALTLLVATAASPGCARLGLVDDGSSISWGPGNNGKLIAPARLPRHGDGFRMPPQWSARGNHFGSDELVTLIVWTARSLQAIEPGNPLGVAHLSPPAGGPTIWHHSHQTGNDADLLFFACDARGRPVSLAEMPHFNGDGKAVLSDGRLVHFDVEREWRLVRTLLQNPVAEIQYLFIYDPLKQLLLDHATAIGEPESLVSYAGWIMRQPTDAAPHDDHLHVRLYCSAADRAEGCRDRGLSRWFKGDGKYFTPRDAGGGSTGLATLGGRVGGLPAMLALGSIPFRGFVPR